MRSAQAENDRSKVVDFIHHPIEECDAAAERLARSADHADRAIGQEWLKARGSEVN